MSEPIINDPKFLDSTINIEGTEYSVTAAKVVNELTIKTMKDGVQYTTKFDGSIPVEVATGDAEKVKVSTDSGIKYAAITISKADPSPSSGNEGDIWFKY